MLRKFKDHCYRCGQLVDHESSCFSGPDPLPHERPDGAKCVPEPIDVRLERLEVPRFKTPILPLTAGEICSVQPMTADVGLLFETTFEPKKED